MAGCPTTSTFLLASDFTFLFNIRILVCVFNEKRLSDNRYIDTWSVNIRTYFAHWDDSEE
jgi:hypothetical protein